MEATIQDYRSFHKIILMLGEPEELFDRFMEEQIMQMKIIQSINPIVFVYYVDGTYECWYVPKPCKYERSGERKVLTESQIKSELGEVALKRMKLSDPQ